MKTILYQSQPFSERATLGVRTSNERLTFADFAKIYGGGLVDTPPNHERPPEGFSTWRTERGLVFAIRDEA